MKRYLGKLFTNRYDQREHDIYVDAGDGTPPRRLDPRDGVHGEGSRLANHSPDGFSWGYQGSGPAQAAIAMLADCMGDRVARHHYQDFKRHVLGRLPMDDTWSMTESEVRAYVAELEARRPLPPEEEPDLCLGCNKLFSECTCG